jgi:drug/metabolite transporter (DMT)-like permease
LLRQEIDRPARHPRLFALTALAMLAFAANPLLCRIALKGTRLDPASFTLVRLASGAITLWLILRWRGGGSARPGSWAGAGSLFVYAAALSYAYVTLDAGIGTLLLFGAVQVTMISVGLARGERLGRRQVAGLAIALIGLIILLAPGATAPSWHGAALMVVSGLAWGIYSLLGHRSFAPVAVTAGNFVGASVLAAALVGCMAGSVAWDWRGVAYAIASGAVASGIGYAIWYTALPSLRATHAAIVQLSVPVIAALGGVVLLGESLTLRLAASSVGILGGIALVVVERGRWHRR